MYFARFLNETPDGPEPRMLVGAGPDGPWTDLRVAAWVRLERRGADRAAARRLASALAPGSLAAAIAAGEAFLDAAREALGEPDGVGRLDREPRLINALDPSGYRDHMIFAGHFSRAWELRGEEVPAVLSELPVAYVGNPESFIGPDDEAPWPSYSRRLDYELELGVVIGREGTDLTPERADDHVFGFTILNDFSARDIQFREMEGRLGPCKGKHFGCAAGPVVATLDELDWRAGLRMTARLNGETVCDGRSDEAIFGLDEVVAWASQGEVLRPGWLLGSGTVNGGSSIEIGREVEPGDVIELEIEGLGVLRNRFGQPGTDGWEPGPRPSAAR